SGIDAALAARAAALAGGSLERARALADEDVCRLGDEVRERASRLARLSVPELLETAEALAGPRGERGREQKEIALAALLDELRAQMLRAAETPSEADGETDVETRRRRARRAAQRLAAAYAASCDLDRNANAQLTWNKLLFDLRALR